MQLQRNYGISKYILISLFWQDALEMHLFVYMSRHPKCTKKLPIPQRCQDHENTCLHQFVAFNHGPKISCHIAEFSTLDFLHICVNTALLEADKHTLTHKLCHRLQFKQGTPQKMCLTHKERETWWLQIHAFNIFFAVYSIYKSNANDTCTYIYYTH